MNAFWHLAGTLVLCTVVAGPLARARWVWRSPHTGVALWQMVGLTWALSVVGLLLEVGLAPYGAPIPVALGRWFDDAVRGDLTPLAVLVVLGLLSGADLLIGLGWTWWSVLRVRRRHRDVLALVARRDEAAPGALVVDHPLVVAYCVPGARSAVVLSSGALDALTPDQLDAVLEHEHTHARERHDLVLLPFSALCSVLPRVRVVREVADAVALLVEMCADYRAGLRCDARSLAAALRRFSAARPPEGALGAADVAVRARLARLEGMSPLPAAARWSVLCTGLVMVSTPLSSLVW
ncbi:M56 family metallopeptidase [Saccharothrix xinjiangensis]|uniref:M56 family metallopeptidase n=1 Tax=Saccharothrix xinjiangensis TaxID=204798 RepID=A0ABV9Y4H5_9PSEU